MLCSNNAKRYHVFIDNTACSNLNFSTRLMQFLMYVDLPYMEDMRELEFPSLSVEGSDTGETSQNKHKPTQEQLDAVDYLIDCMDMSAQPE